MPVTTNLGTNVSDGAPPQIDIRVTNGAGGIGDTALVTVTALWDPAVMTFDSVVSPVLRVTVTNNSCTWTGYGIPWLGSKFFRLRLWRKEGMNDATWVIATSYDARSGDSDTDEYSVPQNPTWPWEP